MNEEGKPARNHAPRFRWKVNMPALVVLGLGIGLTVSLFFVLRSWEEERESTDFLNRASNETDALKWSLENYLEVFSAVSKVPIPADRNNEIYHFVDLKDFQGLLAPPALASLPGLRAVAWVPRVQASQREAYERMARNSDYPKFQITDLSEEGVTQRAASRKVYYPVHHWASQESRFTSLGYDLSTDAAHMEALTTAMRTGKASINMMPEFFTPEGGLSRFEIVQPIYRPGVRNDGSVAEPADVIGFVVGLYSIHDCVRTALGGQDDVEINLKIYQGSVLNGQLVYDQDRVFAVADEDGEQGAGEAILKGLHAVSSVRMPGQAWSLLSYPSPDYLPSKASTWTVWQILAAGILVSVVLGAYMWIIGNRNSFIERLVDERTRQLTRANRELEGEMAERERAQQQLRKVSQAVEQSANMVMITDKTGHIEYINPKFTELMGYKLYELQGETPTVLRSSRTPPETLERVSEVIHEGGQWKGEFYNETKDGKTICVTTNISPIRDESGEVTHFVSVEEDITEQKRLEEQFLQAQKMEVIGRLVGGIAHDFNNILTTILGFGQMFLRKMEPDDWMRNGMEELVYAAERASNLTKQLLTFARKRERAAITTCLNVTEVMQGMDKLLRRTLGEDVELVITPEDEIAMVEGDQTQMEQIMMNLAVNARDAMPRGGQLSIRCKRVKLEENEMRGRLALPSGDYVLLSVGDTGCGMSEEVIDHVFEPFFTTKDLGKGTGLGLSTVFGIVRQMSGDIEIVSEIDKGTEFRIYLPAAKVQLQADKVAVGKTDTPLGKETILVVEDDDSVRRITVASLKELGYQVREARDGLEALNICEKSNGSVDLIFCDIVMPQMSGPDLIDALDEKKMVHKVIYTSGFADHPSLKRTTELEGTHFIEKPFTLELLGRTIRDVLDAA